MSIVMFFIDGFNVYHTLKDRAGKYHKYLWLDYLSLAGQYTKRPGDTISKVHYFTAFAHWKPDAMARHKRLTDALESRGVNVVLGKFKDKDRKCKICNKPYIAKEEKQTDVNIAIWLFREAHKDNYDRAVLITNDTDLVPAILATKESFPGKSIGVLFPIGRSSNELIRACNFQLHMDEKHLRRSQFPDTVEIRSGVSVSRPIKWA